MLRKVLSRFRLMRVMGTSMSPTFRGGELVLVDKAIYNQERPMRGELVAARPSSLGGKAIVKRVKGLPSERVEYCGKALQLGVDEYFVVGDNDEGLDSRGFGPLMRSELIGRIRMQFWPPRSLLRSTVS